MHECPPGGGEPDDEDGQEWVWLWPVIFGALVIIDIWLTTLGVWWFGWWP